MNIPVRNPLLFGLPYFWLGLVTAVSFIETPLKFQVPGITLEFALKLGQLMFGVSTNIQLVLAGAMILIVILDPKTSWCVWLNIAVLILILLLQKIWMLPVLDARADLLIKGAPLPSTDLHNVFIYSEVLKWVLLITLIILQTKKIKIMNTENIDKMSGHWLLAKVGKKVLRPGGKYLTQKMMTHLKISATDRVVEFAPGLGYTANLALQQNPASYVGIDADPDAVDYLSKTFKQRAARFVLGNAGKTALEDGSADKVYGEAMLSMHADHRKSEIIKEAHRILAVGGLYAIHELGLAPDSLDEKPKSRYTKRTGLCY